MAALAPALGLLMLCVICICRRNQPGDREKALSVILPLVEKPERAAPDLYCMCGRIYKDMFIDSGFTDAEKRDQAFYW